MGNVLKCNRLPWQQRNNSVFLINGFLILKKSAEVT